VPSLERLRAQPLTAAPTPDPPQSSLLAPAVAAGAAVACITASTVSASDVVHAPNQPFDFNGFASSYDAASVRRGHQVYTQVCASCHGLARIAYRNLVRCRHTTVSTGCRPFSSQQPTARWHQTGDAQAEPRVVHSTEGSQ